MKSSILIVFTMLIYGVAVAGQESSVKIEARCTDTKGQKVNIVKMHDKIESWAEVNRGSEETDTTAITMRAENPLGVTYLGRDFRLTIDFKSKRGRMITNGKNGTGDFRCSLNDVMFISSL